VCESFESPPSKVADAAGSRIIITIFLFYSILVSSSVRHSKELKYGTIKMTSLPPGVKEAITDKEQLKLLQELVGSNDCGQSHLLDAHRKTNDQAKLQALAAQLLKLNSAYPGGLKGYIQKAKKLLQDSKDGINPLDGWKPSVPQGEKFEVGTSKYDATEQEGMKLLGKTGFVLVAGGLGERLGYNGAKVRFCCAR
jgi:UDP-sugar pyrophosphorylase